MAPYNSCNFSRESTHMRSIGVLLATLTSAVVLTAAAADPIDVPSAQVLKVAIKSSTPRDTWARQDAAAFVLGNVVRTQAGERAKTKAFTSAESARLADLDGFQSAAEKSYLASLPPACNGRDCEERYAYYRCVSAYELSPSFYRAIFDRFFTPDAQKVLAPLLANAGTVWQGAIAMAPNSHPFESFPAPSRECAGGVSPAPATTAGGTTGTAPVPAQSAQATPSDDSIRRARAAGVDVTVLGLTLGEPVRLPACPAQSIFNILGPGIETTCIWNEDPLGVAEDITKLFGVTPNADGTRNASMYDLVIAMPPAKCPDWVAQCQFRVQLSGGRLSAVFILTTGLEVQNDVGAALTQKYKKPTQTSYKRWVNDKTGDTVMSLNMSWNLPGLNVTLEGYPGGTREAFGSVTIEADAITRQRAQEEKAKQDQKQKL